MSVNLKIKSFNDFWLDNAIENFYCLVQEIAKLNPETCQASISSEEITVEIFNKEDFILSLKDKIISRRDTNIFFEKLESKTQLRNNIKKDFVIMQYGSKVSGRNVLKEQVYADKQIEPLLQEVIKDVESDKKNKICGLCNRSYSKKIGNLKQSVYPFSTKIRSLSGVRTDISSEHNIQQLKDYFDNVCPICYLLGVLEWADEGLIYRCYLASGKSIFLLPDYSSLANLHDLKSRYKPGLSKGESRSNIIFKIFRNDGEAVTATPVGGNTLMLGFLEKAIDECIVEDEERSFWSVKKQYGLDSWVLVEVPSGTVKNIKQRHLKLREKTLILLGNSLENNFKVYEQFVNKSNMKYSDSNSIFWEETELLKEALSQSFLEDNFKNFASAMLPRKKAYFDIFLDSEDKKKFFNFIYGWGCKEMGLTPEQLETTEKAAEIIAKVANDHIGDLYKLDKARNLTDLLEGLQQISKRAIAIDDSKYLSFKSLEDFTKYLHLYGNSPADFINIKSTLIILSCMKLASKRKKSQ